MHLSHLFEDLAAWYQIFDFQDRVDTTFRPELTFRATRRRFRKGRTTCRSRAHVRTRLRSAPADRAFGLDAAGVAASRTTSSASTARVYPKGTAVPSARRLQHARQPVLLDCPRGPRHVLRRARGRPPLRRLQPDERRLPADAPRDGRRAARRRSGSSSRLEASAAGFNSILATTHRQNFLVPPRAHRSFPLSELRRVERRPASRDRLEPAAAQARYLRRRWRRHTRDACRSARQVIEPTEEDSSEKEDL